MDLKKRAEELLHAEGLIRFEDWGELWRKRAIQLANEWADARAEEIAQAIEGRYLTGGRIAAEIARSTITKPEPKTGAAVRCCTYPPIVFVVSGCSDVTIQEVSPQEAEER